MEAKRKRLELSLSDPATDYRDLLKNTEEIGEVMNEIERKTMRWFELAERAGV